MEAACSSETPLNITSLHAVTFQEAVIEQAGVMVTLWTCILEVLDSNPGLVTRC
jgi:hypothetical protein